MLFQFQPSSDDNAHDDIIISSYLQIIVGLHYKVIVMRISSVKPVLWLVVKKGAVVA